MSEEINIHVVDQTTPVDLSLENPIGSIDLDLVPDISREVELEIADESDEINLDILEEEEIPLEIEEGGGGTRDYNLLYNKPKLNGQILSGDTDEIDPTVPPWAKEPTKPDYTPVEVGAVDENNQMTFQELKAVWDTYFGGN